MCGSELQTSRVGVSARQDASNAIVADQRMSMDRVALEIRRSGERITGVCGLWESAGAYSTSSSRLSEA